MKYSWIFYVSLKLKKDSIVIGHCGKEEKEEELDIWNVNKIYQVH